jgi:hypothetical protein
MRTEAADIARRGPTPSLVATDLVETLLPAMERLGVATAADIGVETLSERISREVISTDSVIVGRSEIGAWTRV